MKHKLQPEREWETAMYINRFGFLNGKEIWVKYIYINNGKEFVEVMHYTRMLLNSLDKSKVDDICRNAQGDIQKAYQVFFDYLQTEIDFEFVKGFSLDDMNIDDSDINDESSPILSGMMDFCYENWIYNKVEDMAA